MSVKESSEKAYGKGISISIPTIIGIIFVILKLTKLIDWEWIWILAPFWIPLGFVTIIIIFLFVVAILNQTYLYKGK